MQLSISVEVRTGTRLHLGFYGRWFAAGLYVDCYSWRILVEPSTSLTCSGPSASDACRFAGVAASRLGLRGLRVRVVEAPPRHAGFGSTTQLALAVYHAASVVAGRRFDAAEAARVTGRGSTGGAGVWGYAAGWLTLDAPVTSTPPPLLASARLPEEWLVVVITPPGPRVEEGEDEEAALSAASEPPSYATTAALRLVAAARVGDFQLFTTSVEALDRATASMFGGEPFSSPESAEAARLLLSTGLRGVGQSSWGPTVYGFTVEARVASSAVEAARSVGWAARVCRARGPAVLAARCNPCSV